MKPESDVSFEMLNAFVDGELDAAEKSRLLSRIAADNRLKDRVCELWQLKEMVGDAYPLDAVCLAPRRSRRSLPWIPQSLAAMLILALGMGSGWLLHGDRQLPPVDGPNFAVLDGRPKATSKVVLHIFSGEDIRFEGALDNAEDFIKTANAQGRPVQLDIVANSEGLRLLQADHSPFSTRIKAMKQAYKNLNFYACGVTIKRLREKGVDVKLLPEAVITPSAMELIITRGKEGWTYVQA
ncbi:MAG: hypothetical protein KJ558_14080 [Gammaproteobacteria bacterium]|nr:hypothetical protein [Gammaproteobacteria bacterium]MBU1655921.1 hypothetical protein [Gammaproteobacteria bacterium]MBU1961793.1 hypothetical protein [Gammaproteobacteria bacterium]